MNRTVFAGRFFRERTTQPTLERVAEKLGTFGTDRKLIKPDSSACRHEAGRKRGLWAGAMMKYAVDRGKPRQGLDILEFFAGQLQRIGDRSVRHGSIILQSILSMT